jgi:hypothetical protein
MEAVRGAGLTRPETRGLCIQVGRAVSAVLAHPGPKAARPESTALSARERGRRPCPGRALAGPNRSRHHLRAV